jgi:hypothetical protein
MGGVSAPLPRIRGYRLVQKLGEGGMGCVYLGEDELLQRLVAIKTISPSRAGEGEARARFLREARTLATLDHPHVVRVYALGESDAQLYLVMEYVEGQTLAAHLASAGPLPVDQALRIAREVAQALAAAWARGIVHRDVKPANILLDRGAHAKVADFGLARQARSGEAEITAAGLTAGTPHYMAPEQIRGEVPDFHSDVYSLGLVLWEMFAGEKAFKGRTPGEVVARQLADAVPPLRNVRADVPPNVEALVQSMTAKSAEERPPSYPELLRRLDADLEGGGATPTLPSTRSQPRPVDRRRRRPAWLAAAGLAVLAVAGGAWRFAVQRHGSFAVVVAPLHAPDPDSDKEGRVLVTLLEDELRRRLPEDDVDVILSDDVGRPVRTVRGAKALAERYGADVVIWGDALTLGPEVALAPRISRRDGSVLEDDGAAPLPAAGTPGAIEARRAQAAAVAERVATLYRKR